MHTSLAPRRLLTPFALVLFIPITGCGALIGNPGDTDTTPPNSAFIRSIDYTIPSSVSGYSLAGPDNLFEDSMNRLAAALDRINRVIDRLNSDRVAGTGTFTGIGADSKVSVTVTEAKDGPYDLRAVVCYKGAPFQLLTWSSVDGSVRAVRQHNIDPVDSTRAKNLVSDITYTAGTTATLTARLFQAPPTAPLAAVWHQVLQPGPTGGPPPGMDGSGLAELIASTRTGGVYTMSGIHNWVDAAARAAAEGDEYFVGTFTEDGVGETVGYNVARKSECAAVFTEDAAVPNWCTGKSLAGTTYDSAGITAAAERLKAIPVTKHGQLTVPALPSDLACP